MLWEGRSDVGVCRADPRTEMKNEWMLDAMDCKYMRRTFCFSAFHLNIFRPFGLRGLFSGLLDTNTACWPPRAVCHGFPQSYSSIISSRGEHSPE